MGARRLLVVLSLVAAACSGVPGATSTDPTSPPSASPSATMSRTPSVAPAAIRVPSPDVWVFPGPRVYAGDILDVELLTGPQRPDVEELLVTWDAEVVDVEAVALVDPIVGGRISLTDVVDTTDAVGLHDLVVTGTVDDTPFERRRQVRVLPDAVRPAAERDLVWRTVTTDCCTVSAVSGTGPDAELLAVAQELDLVAEDVADRFDVTPDGDVDIILLANPWGNGGFANAGMTVLSLPELDPSPADRRTLFVHELTHVMSSRIADPPTPFEEGLAVQAAGGHYDEVPLREHAAALRARGFLRPLATLYDDFGELQHERRYLQAGAFVEWIDDTAGEDAIQALLRHDAGEVSSASAWLDSATRAVLGTDLDGTDAAFRSWLDGADPDVVAAAPVEELVELQELRRRWQQHYAPWEALYDELDGVEDLDDLDPAQALRRADDPAHVTVERLFAEAQQASADDDRERVAALLEILEPIVDTGRVQIEFID